MPTSRLQAVNYNRSTLLIGFVICLALASALVLYSLKVGLPYGSRGSLYSNICAGQDGG